MFSLVPSIPSDHEPFTNKRRILSSQSSRDLLKIVPYLLLYLHHCITLSQHWWPSHATQLTQHLHGRTVEVQWPISVAQSDRWSNWVWSVIRIQLGENETASGLSLQPKSPKHSLQDDVQHSTCFNMLLLPSHNLVHLLLPLSQDLHDHGQSGHSTHVKGLCYWGHVHFFIDVFQFLHFLP